jgi:sugar lactone lactonase YvrE
MPRCARCLLFVVGLGLFTAGPSRAPADERAADHFTPSEQDAIVPPAAKLELLWGKGEFTEGPAAMADGAILFSDIGNRIYRYEPASGKTSVYRDPSGKSNGLKFDAGGNLVACEGAAPGGRRRISITDPQGQQRVLADRFQGQRFNSPNDLAITSTGRVYFTDPRYVGDEPRELDFEGVFVVEPDGSVRVATRDVQKPNGIIVTPDGRTVYVSDNNGKSDGKRQLVAYRAQVDGTLADKRVLVDFGQRRGIDGMTLDVEGNIYATAGSGDQAGVYVFSPQGRTLALIPTPGDPTNCVFGIGPESTTLYVTAAVGGPASADGKRAYGLYRIRLAKAGYHVFPRGASP